MCLILGCGCHHCYAILSVAFELIPQVEFFLPLVNRVDHLGEVLCCLLKLLSLLHHGHHLVEIIHVKAGIPPLLEVVGLPELFTPHQNAHILPQLLAPAIGLDPRLMPNDCECSIIKL